MKFQIVNDDSPQPQLEPVVEVKLRTVGVVVQLMARAKGAERFAPLAELNSISGLIHAQGANGNKFGLCDLFPFDNAGRIK